jgi:hypothetical protein
MSDAGPAVFIRSAMGRLVVVSLLSPNPMTAVVRGGDRVVVGDGACLRRLAAGGGGGRRGVDAGDRAGGDLAVPTCPPGLLGSDAVGLPGRRDGRVISRSLPAYPAQSRSSAQDDEPPPSPVPVWLNPVVEGLRGLGWCPVCFGSGKVVNLEGASGPTGSLLERPCPRCSGEAPR